MYKVLIADDEPVIREGLVSLDWNSIGAEVIGSVESGLEAVEVLQSEFVDVLLTDIRMPGMDGIGLAKFVAENELYTEVVLLSGYSDFEYAQQAIHYNVRAYLLKPTKPEEILAAVQRVYTQVEKRRERDIRYRMLKEEMANKQLTYVDGEVTLLTNEYVNVVKKVLKYIAAHYSEPISLMQVSRELHYSTTYLSRIIKKDSGYNFIEILNAVRIHAAADKLREGERSLSEICLSVGIDDPRYFSQVFKKFYGVSPSGYKKKAVSPRDQKLEQIVRHLLGGHRDK